MSYTNQFFIGVNGTGYHVLMPIHGAYTDDEMIEVAALIVAMKPQNREKFDKALERIESGEGS